jgi:hypothetical protein
VERSTTCEPSTDTVTVDPNLAYHAGAPVAPVVPVPSVLVDADGVVGVAHASARTIAEMEKLK